MLIYYNYQVIIIIILYIFIIIKNAWKIIYLFLQDLP